MSFHGADLGHLLDLRRDFALWLDWWTGLDAEIGRRVRSIVWQGPDADRAPAAIAELLRDPLASFLAEAELARQMLDRGIANQHEASKVPRGPGTPYPTL